MLSPGPGPGERPDPGWLSNFIMADYRGAGVSTYALKTGNSGGGLLMSNNTTFENKSSGDTSRLKLKKRRGFVKS